MKNYLEEELYELIRQDNSLFDFIQYSLMDGLWYWDLEHPENEWMNRRFWQVLGYDPELMPHTPESWHHIINQGDLAIALENFRKHLENENHPYDQEVRYTHKNGSTVWIRCCGKAIRDKNGIPIRMLGLHSDITRLKNSEELLLAREKADDNESKLTQLVEALPQLFWTCTSDGRCDYLSPQWVAYTGIPEKPQMGYGWLSQIHPDDKDKVLHDWTESYAHGNPFDIDFRIKKFTGEYRWFKSRAVPIKNKQQEVIKWFGSNTDIHQIFQAEQELIRQNEDYEKLNKQLAKINTQLLQSHQKEIKYTNEIATLNEKYLTVNEKLEVNNYALVQANGRAAENERYFSLAFYSNPCPLNIVSFPEGEILAVNEAWCKLYDYSDKQAIGNTTATLNIWIDPEERAQAIKKLQENQEFLMYECDIRSGHDVIKTVLLSANRFQWCGKDSLITSSIDITDRKRMEKECIVAKNKAEENDRLKTAFLQNMSHEIRTPINAIMGFSDLLIPNIDNSLKTQKFVNIIKQRSEDLLSLIDELMDISKIESGVLSLNLGPCRISDLFIDLDQYFANLQNKQNKSHISFRVKVEPSLAGITIRSDATKLRQIFINLISNGLKFTETGSITLECLLQNKDQLVFKVTDTGTGIPENKREQIFERFVQLPNSTRKNVGGTGLGLAIVKGLVDLLNGKITVESEINLGTTISVSVPFILEDKQMMPVEQLSENQILTDVLEKNILVVEDDEFNAMFLVELLSQLGLNTTIANSGMEALKAIEYQSFDLVLMDIGLPDMSGYEVVRRLLLVQPGLKIVAQSAYASPEDRRTSLITGCIDYISKPIRKPHFIEILRKHLGKDLLSGEWKTSTERPEYLN